MTTTAPPLRESMIRLRATPDEVDRLSDYATAAGRDKSEIVRTALDLFLEANPLARVNSTVDAYVQASRANGDPPHITVMRVCIEVGHYSITPPAQEIDG